MAFIGHVLEIAVVSTVQKKLALPTQEQNKVRRVSQKSLWPYNMTQPRFLLYSPNWVIDPINWDTLPGSLLGQAS